MTELFRSKKSTNNSIDLAEFSWQEIVDNYRTFATEIKCDADKVRELLEE